MTELGISVIVPCYMAGEYLIEAVDSIRNQPFRYPYEIIIVDDGSPDEQTRTSIDRIALEKHVTIILLENNQGAQFARNVGLQAAKFPYILMVDADDCLNLDSSVLEKGTYADLAIDILRTNPKVAFVHTLTYMFGDFEGLTMTSYPISESLILEKHHVPICIIYRRQDAIEAGLYDESIIKWQDWSFTVGILNTRFLSGQENIIAFFDEPYYLYRIHKQTNRISSKKVNEKEMIKKTVLRHPDIFKNYYKGKSNEEIIETVFLKKPSKIKDLLFIASHDLKRALEMASQRRMEIQFTNEFPDIP